MGLLAPVSAQAQNRLPTLGDGAELTTSAERRLGDGIARQLYRDPDYLDDPVLVEYAQTQWQALLAAARAQGEVSPELDERFAWEVLLGRDRSVNAFALPGGYLGVHLGLIGVTASRDELASVLAHELSHVTQRHIARLVAQQGKQAPLLLGSMILAVLAASKNPEAAQALAVGGQALAVQNQLNFSRDMEREADRVGFGLMDSAGFAPQGFVAMFDKLQQANRLMALPAQPPADHAAPGRHAGAPARRGRTGAAHVGACADGSACARAIAPRHRRAAPMDGRAPGQWLC
jgi:predicted Zn-dependent protease